MTELHESVIAGGEPELDRLSLAIQLAAVAHCGQVYYGSPPEPYIIHCLRVMFSVPAVAKVVAVLHDLKEDTDHELPEWLTEDERGALALLTHDKENVLYPDYIEAIGRAEGPAGNLARIVKRADLDTNLSRSPTPAQREKYATAIRLLDRIRNEVK